MLVCHCHAVYDHEVEDLVDAGAGDEFDVAQACGAGTDCGGCLPAIATILRQTAPAGCPKRPLLAEAGPRMAAQRV